MNGTVAVVAVAAVLALIVIVVMRGRKRQQSEWQAAATELGMELMAAPDPALMDAIIALHRPPVPDGFTQKWSLPRIYRYPESGAACYSVTVHLEQTREHRGSRQTPRVEWHDTRVVAIVAPDSLRAPRMQLEPRAVVDPAAGTLAAMAVQAANAMTDSAAEQRGSRVEFADDPEFDRRYLVLSPQPDQARAFLSPARRQGLAGLEDVQVSLEGSLMLVSSTTDRIRHRGRSLEESLRAELENARRAIKIFGATR